MQTLSIIFYAIGSVLLISSCFTTGIAITWWLGSLSVLFLILGCVFQFNFKKRSASHRY
jgi:glucose uptake protein GlcU